MKKRFIMLIPAILLYAGLNAAEPSPRIDETALHILQQTVNTLQSIHSCSFTATANFDVPNNETGLVKHLTVENVSMDLANDHLKIISRGDKGNRTMWYNGETFTYYSVDNNKFGEIQMSDDLMNVISTMNTEYGFDFPAADFFFDTFVQDIVDTGGNLIYLGLTTVNGKDCFHVAGKDANAIYQFWIYDDGLYLPARMVITYHTEPIAPQYDAVYTDWSINPSLPDAMFEFMIPPQAGRIEIIPIK